MEPKRQALIRDVELAIANKNTEHDVLMAAVQLIDDFSEHFNWTGFYMLRGDMLEVGPYIGPETEHVKIPLSAGICGAAAYQKKTIIVDDVRLDPRFIACSINTRSEIVVPLMDGSRVLGEIDIDSNTPNYFVSDDRIMLEAVAEVIVRRLKLIG